MEGRLHQLGWREIEVVDDDLGRSAAGAVTRAGFERMVAEVILYVRQSSPYQVIHNLESQSVCRNHNKTQCIV